MVARYAAASLGLAAFTVVLVAGLLTQNPVTTTLSRGILALFLFCFIGLILGGAAQLIIAEHQRAREAEIHGRIQDASPSDGATVGISTSQQKGT